jgi:hypothetical protein
MTLIFCFGSNNQGAHVGGAAREAALHFDAQEGVAEGRTGRSYAIPTMSPQTIEDIEFSVKRFIRYAKENPQLEFFVTAIGCGLAGYSPEQIAPMFNDAPVNCTLHRRLVEVKNTSLEAIPRAQEEDRGLKCDHMCNCTGVCFGDKKKMEV